MSDITNTLLKMAKTAEKKRERLPGGPEKLPQVRVNLKKRKLTTQERKSWLLVTCSQDP
jgi:hypothetical protein